VPVAILERDGTPAKDLTLNFVFCAVSPLGAMQGYGNAFGGQAGTAGASVISFELVLRLVSTELNFVLGSFPFGFIPLSPRFVRNARLIFRRDIISASTVIAKPSSVKCSPQTATVVAATRLAMACSPDPTRSPAA
jgi:hypothetical protein